uniref:Uncharacterized protein n=1 Tax=Arundo donax TaxID=35708 RepID=A0A0A9G3Y2_ARUDO
MRTWPWCVWAAVGSRVAELSHVTDTPTEWHSWSASAACGACRRA